mmetsp:Transcript_12635/g.21377  ORF Transcript_12635/g.21377 Transcript_12635/m.21377 type:complete len:143 (-) Transcript_12635:138-566(-)
MASTPPWKAVSVIANASPSRVWHEYSKLAWHEWDHDISEMSGTTLKDGETVKITMQKEGRKHHATLSDVQVNKCFSYSAPLPGSKILATHTLEKISENQTKITHTFDFEGVIMGSLYQWLTRKYVQDGLDSNTLALKKLVEE